MTNKQAISGFDSNSISVWVSDNNSRRSGTIEIPNSRSTDETAREIKLKLSGKVSETSTKGRLT